MPVHAQAEDAVSLDSLRVSYDKSRKRLDRGVYLADGSNVYQTLADTIRKRGGQAGGGSPDIVTKTLAGRIDRIGVYETLDSPSRVYLLASVYDGTDWEMFRLRLDDGTGNWTTLGSLRALDASTQPHEWVIAKGKAYIFGFPSGASGEKLGTVVFDGSGTPTVRPWGLLGPTQPARITDPAGWAASANPISVKAGWQYFYTWETADEHNSARSPLEFDPAQQPSDTGAFTDKLPVVTLRGHADTTNIPNVVVWRTSDGGGSARRLATVANPGDSNFTYTDDDLDGSNPIPDAKLDPTDTVPSLTSNLPPPRVLAPLKTGVDTPQPLSAPPVYWRNRIWYGIGSTVFYSGDEEISNGVPEHSFPGGFFGNFFTYQDTIRHLGQQENQLVVAGANDTFAIFGRDRETFRTDVVIPGLGAAEGHPRAKTKLGNGTAWLSHDFRVVAVQDRQRVTLSKPLAGDIKAWLDGAAGREIGLVVYSAFDRDWLVVAGADPATPSNARWWVLTDIAGNDPAPVWSPPWTGMRATAVAYGPPRETDRLPRLLVALHNGGSPGTGLVAYYADATYQDLNPGGAAAGYAFNAETNLLPIPTGNMVNAVNRAGRIVELSQVRLEWLSGVTAPTLAAALDSTASPTTVYTGVDSTISPAPSGYVSKFYPIEQLAERAKLKVSRTADTEGFELESVAFLWAPGRGA